MSSDGRRLHLTFSLLVSLAMWIAATVSVAQAPASVPKIWDDAALADWATPIAALKVRPGHYTAAEYYSVSADNLRTYPVYLPDKEPPGYWESLQKKKPEPLVDVSKIRTKSDWIEAGARAFRELDNPFPLVPGSLGSLERTLTHVRQSSTGRTIRLGFARMTHRGVQWISAVRI